MERQTEDRIIRIKLTDGTQVNAQINIKRDPGYDRLSDIVASSKEPFLILSNATSFHKDLNEPVQHKTLFVNKDHIMWASPDDNQEY